MTAPRAASRATRPMAADRCGRSREALRLAQSGDTIVLANTQRPYRESISLVGSRHSGTAQEPFTIRGNGAILDGSAPVPPAAWENYAGPVFRFRPPHLGCQQLFLDDRPATRVFAAPTAGGPPELQPRQWCLLDGQIYFCVDLTKLPGDYHLSYAREQTGITLYHVERVRDRRPGGARVPDRRHRLAQQRPKRIARRRHLPRQRAQRRQPWAGRRWRISITRC